MNEWMRRIKWLSQSTPASLLGENKAYIYKRPKGRFHIRMKAYTIYFISEQKGTNCMISFENSLEGWMAKCISFCQMFYILTKTLCLVKITLPLGDNACIYNRCKYFHGKRLTRFIPHAKGLKTASTNETTDRPRLLKEGRCDEYSRIWRGQMWGSAAAVGQHEGATILKMKEKEWTELEFRNVGGSCWCLNY